jgi:hypothetical protein
MSDAYFCLVTWPDGREGLLFPRPGNVPVNTTLEDGLADYNKAVGDLKEHVERHPSFNGTKVKLVKFQRLEVVKELQFPEPVVEKIPPFVYGYPCEQCGRQKSHIYGIGYVCEYCAGIED